MQRGPQVAGSAACSVARRGRIAAGRSIAVSGGFAAARLWNPYVRFRVRRQVSSGFKTYVTEPAYPDGYLPTPKYPGVSVICSGYCK